MKRLTFAFLILAIAVVVGCLASCSYSEVDEAQARIEELESQVDELQTEIDKLKSGVSDIRSSYDSLSSEIDSLCSESDRFDFEDWSCVVGAVRSEASNVRSLADDLDSTISNIE